MSGQSTDTARDEAQRKLEDRRDLARRYLDRWERHLSLVATRGMGGDEQE